MKHFVLLIVFTIFSATCMASHFSPKPKFMNGDIETFHRWVEHRIRILKEDQGLEGTVVVAFTVKRDGCVDDVEILSAAHQALADDVLRVVNMSPKWTWGATVDDSAEARYELKVKYTERHNVHCNFCKRKPLDTSIRSELLPISIN